MCKAASFIVVKGEPPKWSKQSDSHEIIREEHQLPHNTDTLTANVQVEITPPNETDYETPLSEWVFRVDQDRLPKWWDAKEAEEAVRKELNAWAKCKLFVNRNGEVRNQEAYACGSSTVMAYDSSKVMAYDSSTVMAYDSSTVMAYDSSTVMAYDSSTVTACGSSTVTACGSSTVMAYDSSTVTARGSSTVTARGSSTVTAYDSSTVTACVMRATVSFHCKFSCSLVGELAVIVNLLGNVAKRHVGSNVERVVTDKD